MRISTTQLYTEANRNMMEGQTKLAEIQDKIASGKNFTSLADDPVGANQAVNLRRELAQIDMFQSNIDATRRRLDLEETTLSNLNLAFDRARELSVQAASNTLTDIDRQAISYELEELVAYAANLMNTRDAKGEYLFSGSKGTTPTYAYENGQYVYQGDAGNREIQIGSSVYVDSTDSGRALFEAISGDSALIASGDLAAAIVAVDVTDQTDFDQLMRSTGDLRLSVSRINDGAQDVLVYSVLDSAGNPIYSQADGPILNVPYTDLEASPNELQVDIKGATLTLSLPSSEQLTVDPTLTLEPGVADPSATFSIGDIDAMQTQFAGFPGSGSLSLVVSGSGTVPDPYTYQLQNEDGDVVQDETGAGVEGAFTAGDIITAVLDGWDLTFTPVAPTSPPETQLTVALETASALPGLRVVGGEDSLITDIRIADSTDYTNYMLGDDTTAGASDLQLDVQYSAGTGYSWSVVNDSGVELDSGIYQDPSIGVLTSAFDGVEASVGTPITIGTAGVDPGFTIEVDGVRSATLQLTGGASYTSMTDLVGDLQALVDADPVLGNGAGGANISVAYSSADGFTFTAADSNAQLQFAEVDGAITTALEITSTTNKITLVGLGGAEIDLELPTEAQDFDATLGYAPPTEALLRFNKDKTNILNALQDTVTALRLPREYSAAALADFNAHMEQFLNQLGEAQTRVGDTISTLGSRQNAVNRAESSNFDFKLMTQTTLSAIEDVDYAKASTDLARRQLALEAAYASFAKIQGLSLFDYLR